jgi:spermidine/putrescine transport system substrate-binding protein
MSKKLFTLVVLTALALTLVPTAVAAPPPQAEGKVYTVQKDDWLSKLADKEYGDVLAYPAIVHYNNLMAETDKTLVHIDNPDLIEIGWSIYLPTAAEAESYLAMAMEEPAAAELQFIGGQLNYLGWEGYDDPKAFEPFYEKTGVVLNATYAANNDEIVAKFKAGGAGTYDVGDINIRYLGPMVAQGMLMPLDEARLTSLNQLFPAFEEIAFGRVDGKLYGIPAFFGSTTLCYRADLVPAPEDWDYWRREPYKDKYAVAANPLGSIYMWALGLGKSLDASTWTQDDLAEIKAYGMEKWQNATTVAASIGEQKDLLSRGVVVVTDDCYDLVSTELQAEGIDVKSIAPKGKIKLWVDYYFIWSGAKNVDAAYAWINYAIGKDAMTQMAKDMGMSIANEKSYELLDEELRAQLGYATANETILNAEINLLPLPDAEPPYVSVDDLYKAFDEIRASVQ